MSAALEVHHNEQTPLARTEQPALNLTPMQMAYQLIQGGADLGSVKEMLAVSKELSAEQAKRSFSVAIAAAKAELKPIVKNRDGHNIRYADFSAIAVSVDPVITKHGLSYRFRTSQVNGRIHVTCIIEHVDGHSEENTLEAPSDDSGKKNAIQAIGSTLTYLQRYSLIQAFGLAVANDDDGHRSGEKEIICITDEQQMQIREMLEATESDEQQFLKLGGISNLSDMAANQFGNAMNLLKQRMTKRAGQ